MIESIWWSLWETKAILWFLFFSLILDCLASFLTAFLPIMLYLPITLKLRVGWTAKSQLTLKEPLWDWGHPSFFFLFHFVFLNTKGCNVNWPLGFLKNSKEILKLLFGYGRSLEYRNYLWKCCNLIILKKNHNLR